MEDTEAKIFSLIVKMFKWHGASRGPSATDEPLIGIHMQIIEESDQNN